MSIDKTSSTALAIRTSSTVKIPDFISIDGKPAVSASFDFSNCPVELQETVLRFIERSQLSLPTA